MDTTLWGLIQLLPDAERLANFQNYEKKGFPVQVRESCAMMIEAFWLERNFGITSEDLAEMCGFTQHLILLARQKANDLGEYEAGLALIRSTNFLETWGAEKVAMVLKECVDEDLKVLTEFNGSYEEEPHRIIWMMQTLKYKELLVRSDTKTLRSILLTDLKKFFGHQTSLRMLIEFSNNYSKNQLAQTPIGSLEHVTLQNNLETVKRNIIFLRNQLHRVATGILQHCRILCTGLREAYDDMYGAYLKRLKMSSNEGLQQYIPQVSVWMKQILNTTDWAIHEFLQIRQLVSPIAALNSQLHFKLMLEAMPGLHDSLTRMRKELLQNVMVVSQQGPNVYKRGNIFQKTQDSKGVKVQLLAGGSHFSGVQVEAIVINEEQGRGLILDRDSDAVNFSNLDENHLTFAVNPFNEIIGNGSATGLISNTALFSSELTNLQDIEAVFGNLTLPAKQDIKRSYPPKRKAMQEKFCILFRSRCLINGEKVLNWCCSAPFTYAVHVSQRTEGEATIFWDESFRPEIRRPFTVLEEVSMEALLTALNRFFNKFTCTNRPFSQENVAFLRNKIQRELNLKSENQKVSMTEFCASHTKLKPDEVRQTGQTSLTFWDWFFGAAELVKNHIQEYWNSGHIVGFINKVEAGNILQRHEPGTLMIRFPEIEAGTLHYAIHEPDGTIAHWEPVSDKVLGLFPLPENMMSTMKNGHAKEICHYNENAEFRATNIEVVFGEDAKLSRPSTRNTLYDPYKPGDPGRIPFVIPGATAVSVLTPSNEQSSSQGIAAMDATSFVSSDASEHLMTR